MMYDFMSKVHHRIGQSAWPLFIGELKQGADRADNHYIDVRVFRDIMKKFHFNVGQSELDRYMETYPGMQDSQDNRTTNIAQFYNYSQIHLLKKTYKSIKWGEQPDNEEAIDISGFTGNFHREKIVLHPISQAELYDIVTEDQKHLAQIILNIHHIDKDHNGYVTMTELDDILKLEYPA